MPRPISPAVGAILREIPSVDELLASARIRALLEEQPRWAVLDAVRAVLAESRQQLLSGDLDPEAGRALVRSDAVVERVAAGAARKAAGSLRPVLNATGVILHTNLGRAPLAGAALDAIRAAAQGYSTLEFDLATGERGSRQAHVESLLLALTGAEAALVINNNAAAVFLGINTLANGREVVISRGELVEIGDSFRIPDVMTEAGGRLREVGTTNRTVLRDYEQAVGPETALLLKVHRSNFELLGFTAEVDVADLAALGKARGLPTMQDLGSGALLDLSAFGCRREPLPSDAIRAGMDLVTFSGDKLLGGPQAGIVVGRRDLVARLRRNPLARAVRIDKLCLAGLEATLRLLRDPERARQEIPVLRMLSRSVAEIGARAETLATRLASATPALRATVEDATSEVGGGALPLQVLPTRVVSLEWPDGAGALESRLRLGNPPLLVRIKDDRVLLDLRTVDPDDDAVILGCILNARQGQADGA
ncbi:MAG TPA: L-seryl-tRNA(Sec) selenium transferase [Candidatus Baltobacteraceae bacterium]|nr:L-seryl-tRNA(Sec) selenium transferase [Candidatus Baltobacteraceae bacterium]